MIEKQLDVNKKSQNTEHKLCMHTDDLLGSVCASTDDSFLSTTISPLATTSLSSFDSPKGSNDEGKKKYSLISVIEYGVSSEQGNRKTMEDRHCVLKQCGMSTSQLSKNNLQKSQGGGKDEKRCESCKDEGSISINSLGTRKEEDIDPNFPSLDNIPVEQLAQGVPFFAVYDGHGGYQCAAFLRKELYKLVLSHPKVFEDPETALKEAICNAENEYLKTFTEDISGSTLACVIMVEDKIIAANVGDTETVLSRAGKACLLSEKHNVKKNENEQKRVEEAGGRIFQGRVGHPLYNPSVLSLAVSRTIGDAGFKLDEFTNGKNSGIIATPSTKTVKLDPKNDDFLIIGCDGLWDVLSYQEAVDFCHSKLKELKESGKTSDVKEDSQAVTSALVRLALDKGTLDNVTVMFINFELLRRMRPNSANGVKPPGAVHHRWTEALKTLSQSKQKN